MTRILSLLTVLTVIGFLGCRMCGSSLDSCVPAYTQRADDYRGCDPLYRSGSIFYVADGGSDYFMNAGNFGQTVSVDGKTPTPTPGPKRTRQIGVPDQPPKFNGNGNGNVNRSDDPTYNLPSVEELLNSPPTTVPVTPTPHIMPEPESMPVTPPSTQPAPAVESMPFTSQYADPRISLEELRRLDPSITDVKILNIDDALDAAFQEGTK